MYNNDQEDQVFILKSPQTMDPVESPRTSFFQ